MRHLLAILTLASLASSSFGYFDADVFVPRTSIEHSWDIGVRAHTNHLIYTGREFYPSQDDRWSAALIGAEHGPFVLQPPGPSGYHPSDLQTAYGDHSAGGGTIAIVDAYHFPTALNDFNTFSTQFVLPTEVSINPLSASNSVFQVVYASGSQPSTDGGWSQEMALDIEWAHAMAPSAKIVLVEANSSSFSDLFTAVGVAASLPGVTQVSMSWGGSEWGFETFYDGNFVVSGVSFFASSGDVGGGRNYPAMSPNVISVGGTSLTFPSGVAHETGWGGSGGGLSQDERMPTYQDIIMSIVRSRRGVPDIAADADPSTGVAIYDSTSYQGFVDWFVIGGTSVAAPVCASIANAGGHHRGGGQSAYIYAHPSGFTDITSGSSGPNMCKKGWDFVTGWGSPKSAASF